MRKKIFVNVLYNIGIFLCVVTIYWAVPLKRYEFVLGAAAIAGMIIFLKIKLIKEVRDTQNNP